MNNLQIRRYLYAQGGASLLFLLAFLTSSCKSDDEAFLKTYGGIPYMGTVQVDIIRPDGSYVKTEYGNGSAQFVGTDKGKVKMIVFGAINNKKGDAGFAIDGLTKQKTWKCESDSVQLNVNEKGLISGDGKSYPQQFMFSGKITDTRFELVTELKNLKASDGGLPVGTIFKFTYALGRDLANKSGNRKPCKKIIWRSQYVANFDGTGTTVRVPECVSE